MVVVRGKERIEEILYFITLPCISSLGHYYMTAIAITFLSSIPLNMTM